MSQESRQEKRPGPSESDAAKETGAGDPEKERGPGGGKLGFVIVGALVVALLVAVYLNRVTYGRRAREKPKTPAGELGPGSPEGGPAVPSGETPPGPPLSKAEEYRQWEMFNQSLAAQHIFRSGKGCFILANIPAVTERPEGGQRHVYTTFGRLFDATTLAAGLDVRSLYRRHFAPDKTMAADDLPPLGIVDKRLPEVLPKFAPAAEAKLSEDDLVVGLQVGNAAKAYPIRYLNIHEVVNDTVGDAPAVIVWSALADTATALDRRIGDKVLQFGDAALIYQGAIVIYDVESLCLWTPISGKALTGPYAGGQALKPLQTVETTWKYWRSHYPNSMVLVGAAAKLPEMQKEMDSIDYTKNPQLPVPDYRTSDALVYPVEGFDIKGTPLPPKTIVFGIEVGTHARAYPQNVVAQKGEIRETLDGRELRVSYNAEGGFALAADAENNPILCQKMYWIVWKGLHPKSDIFGGVEKPAEKALPGAKPEGRREAPPPITPPLEKDSS